MLRSRERVKKALNHETTDRPPADLGSTCNTSITKIAYNNLRKHLGYPSIKEPEFLSRDMQVVKVDEPILERLHIDTRGIQANPPDVSKARQLSEDSYVDEWGIKFKAAWRNDELLYYNAEENPLSFAETVADVENYDWPDPCDPGRIRGLKDRARALKQDTDYAIVAHMGDTSIFQACMLIRGMERFLMDLIENKLVARALLEKVLEIQSIKMERYLEEVGEYIDVVGIGDDFAGQRGPLISPNLFRSMVKPYLRAYFKLVKSKTPAKLHLHSCGAVSDLLDDLIEIGVDIINPVQVSARGMMPEVLKDKFGQKLCFWGGIDTRSILPKKTPAEVAAEVRRIAGILGEDGGYVLNPVHNIQPDVPPENVIALFDSIIVTLHFSG